jgi:hypothetical protein
MAIKGNWPKVLIPGNCIECGADINTYGGKKRCGPCASATIDNARRVSRTKMKLNRPPNRLLGASINADGDAI